MNMKAYVVIGAGYGDEGKGLIVDRLTRRTKSNIVCRFNGGGQAAHTVQTETDRHVFNTLSAGSFANAETYLSSQFIFNPFLVFDELRRYSKIRRKPVIYCHPDAIVTTIFDIAMNNIIEMSRGDKRHGSCGLGINETVVRSMDSNYRLTVGDLYNKSDLRDKLTRIMTEWVPHRMQILGINDAPPEYHAQTNNVLLNCNIDQQVDAMRSICNMVMPVSTKLSHLVKDTVIFEGAQGLRLDQDLGRFPHITRSYTGVFGALHAMEIFDVTEIQPIYVTRAYLTRHGAGPLRHEGEIASLAHFDATNRPNDWQGALRFAPLDLSDLQHYIVKDWIRTTNQSTITMLPPKLAITCLDQQKTIFSYDTAGVGRTHDDPNEFVRYVQDRLEFEVMLTSFGPTAQDVRVV